MTGRAAPWEPFFSAELHTRACTCPECARRFPRAPHSPASPDPSTTSCRYCGGRLDGVVWATCQTCGSSRYMEEDA